MSTFALGLILISAVAHATWNLYAKRASGGPAFVWLFDVASTLLYAPLALIVVLRPHAPITLLGFGFIAGSAVLHLAYFLMLQQGYRIGDLSLVYPLARGTGPMLSTTAAILVFGERPGPLALAGAVGYRSQGREQGEDKPGTHPGDQQRVVGGDQSPAVRTLDTGDGGTGNDVQQLTSEVVGGR